MTREEAIEVLEKMKYPQKVNKNGFIISNVNIENEALEMAIQALEQNESAEKWYKLFVEKLYEQEPCDKCVYSTKDGYCQYDDISETIPPLEPCDAISREDAITAISQAFSWVVPSHPSKEVREILNKCKENLRELPLVTQKLGNCNTCEYEEDKDSGECYECVKGIQDWYKPKQTVRQSGKWEDLHSCWLCSECGYETHIEHKYCPNCGAKMESEDKE